MEKFIKGIVFFIVFFLIFYIMICCFLELLQIEETNPKKNLSFKENPIPKTSTHKKVSSQAKKNKPKKDIWDKDHPIQKVYSYFSKFFQIEKINPKNDIFCKENPIQKECTSKENLSIENIPQSDYKNVVIKAKAEYEIQARLALKTKYNDRDSGIAQCDLALVWGEIAQANNFHVVTYSQSNRWYYFTTHNIQRFSVQYVGQHSCNLHAIASTQEIQKKIDSLNKYDIVQLKGYLVNVTWKDKNNQNFYWNSSLRRDDLGDGACELMYITDIHIIQN